MPESFRTDEYLVRGCQSQVWLVHEVRDNRLFFQADSDAFIVPRHAGCDVTEDNRLACASRRDEQRALVTSAKAVTHSLHG